MGDKRRRSIDGEYARKRCDVRWRREIERQECWHRMAVKRSMNKRRRNIFLKPMGGRGAH